VEKAKGIRVAEWLVAQKVDVVLLPVLSAAEGKQSLRGKGPTYVFSNAGVEMQETSATTLSETLAEVS
jgi:predicted Fe-Mo cluster-binding NifX family protein